jgi:cytochrome c biogenesis protein CcdA
MLALTAMSALSASTYSCGGDAGLFGKGGEEGALIASGFGAGLKYLFSPVGLDIMLASTSSSLEGGEEREELSERDISM